MIAKFSTKNSAMDYFRYVRKNALVLVAAGVVFGIAGLASGIAMLAVAGNIAGGSVLLIAGLLIAAGLIVYGLYGLKSQFLKNTLLTGLETNVTEFNEDGIVITQTGKDIDIVKKFGYMHVARVVELSDCFQIEMKDNTLILCTKQSLIEGDADALTDLFAAKFNKQFINRCENKFNIITDTGVENESEKTEDIAEDTIKITEDTDGGIADGKGSDSGEVNAAETSDNGENIGEESADSDISEK